MGASFSISIHGAGAAERKISNLAKRIRNPRKTLKRIGIYLEGLSMDAFRRSEDPETHTPWKPLAASTIANRRRGEGSRGIKILVDTGELMSSIHSVVFGDRAVAVGTNLEEKGQHQFGIQRKNVPARPFLGVDSPGLDEIARIMVRSMEEAVR